MDNRDCIRVLKPFVFQKGLIELINNWKTVDTLYIIIVCYIQVYA